MHSSVAVHQQDALAVQVDDGAVREQAHAGLAAEALADQEIAVAVDEIASACRRSSARAGPHDATLVRVGVVVADPGFEQIAEDVQRLAPARFALEEVEELRGDVRPRRRRDAGRR